MNRTSILGRESERLDLALRGEIDETAFDGAPRQRGRRPSRYQDVVLCTFRTILFFLSVFDSFCRGCLE